jgi:UDPglucose--hexose-1-phosphate uridylyltransferase
MSRYAIHPITTLETLIVPSRASRPNAFARSETMRCPFCPGHESDTPPTIAVATEGSEWKVRVFPNLYPITSESLAGTHEVIVDTPTHEQRPHQLEQKHLQMLVDIYADRFDASRKKGHAYSVLFKNDGAAAGQSLEHPHTQFIGLELLPESIWKRPAETRCTICAESTDHRLIVSAGESIVCLSPSASRLPFELLIVPADHQTEPIVFLRRSREAIAALLLRAMVAIHEGFGGVAFNLIIESCARAPRHAAISLVPRLTTLGGFELATNMLINVVDPRDAATRYRELMGEG